MNSSLRSLHLARVVGLLALAGATLPSSALAQQKKSTVKRAKPAVEAQVLAPSPSVNGLPAPSVIIDKFISAIGGRDAITKRTSMSSIGTFEVPAAGLKGAMHTFSAAPNRSVVTITLPGMGEMRNGFDGTTGWSIDPAQGPSILRGRQLDERRMDSDFYSVLHDPATFKTMSTDSLTEFQGRKAYVVRLVRPSGDETVEYYDPESGLMVGSRVTRDTPMGPIGVTTILADYKDFGSGLKIPSRVTQRMLSGQELSFSIDSLVVDKVDPAMFELPPEIKAIKP